MAPLVLVFLALIWAVVLIPPMLKNRAESRVSSSITSFNRNLSVLQNSNKSTAGTSRWPIHSSVPQPRATTAAIGGLQIPPARLTREQAARRRREVCFGLVVAAVLTLGLAISFGGAFVLLHVLADALLVGYALLWHQANQRRHERTLKVHYLPTAKRAEPSRPVLLRQSVN
ncbi:MAG: hypothetical protein JJLCMIEE_02162 [Acidimicrobiales bacterium]|nr:hypothetical protein [Acidimicrobiales bacterium]